MNEDSIIDTCLFKTPIDSSIDTQIVPRIQDFAIKTLSIDTVFVPNFSS